MAIYHLCDYPLAVGYRADVGHHGSGVRQLARGPAERGGREVGENDRRAVAREPCTHRPDPCPRPHR